MKKFFDSLKDFLYDSTDYIIMTLIVISVISVIGWRLDVLFAKDNSDSINTLPIEEILESNDMDDYNETSAEESSEEESLDEPSIEDEDLKSDIQDFTVSVNIPEGSLPGKIGEILESNGLVENKNAFISRAQELNLDRKLRSGSYKFNSNDTLDDIIKKIANIN